MLNARMERRAFSLIELLIVIAILAVLTTIVFVIVFPALAKARDARRIFEITNIGRFVVVSCPLPEAGAGTYDFTDLAVELRTKFPRYAESLSTLPKDPSVGTETRTFYYYTVANTLGVRKCALFTNLENANAAVTNAAISGPTAGGGSGVFAATSSGWNGTDRYYQVSN
jgi:prepilin-type N-terminal cleavage/methylation domain-containing protein